MKDVSKELLYHYHDNHGALSYIPW